MAKLVYNKKIIEMQIVFLDQMILILYTKMKKMIMFLTEVATCLVSILEIMHYLANQLHNSNIKFKILLKKYLKVEKCHQCLSEVMHLQT